MKFFSPDNLIPTYLQKINNNVPIKMHRANQNETVLYLGH